MISTTVNRTNLESRLYAQKALYRIYTILEQVTNKTGLHTNYEGLVLRQGDTVQLKDGTYLVLNCKTWLPDFSDKTIYKVLAELFTALSEADNPVGIVLQIVSEEDITSFSTKNYLIYGVV